MIAANREHSYFVEARRQPLLPFAGFDLTPMVRALKEELFPEIQFTPPIYFIARGPLACVCHDESSAEIFIHNILNTDETPDYVFQHIILHELTHLRVKPREVDGKLSSHPPEFWEMEKLLSPQKDAAWSWLKEHIGPWWVRNEEEEGYYIRKEWYRRRSDIKRAAAMRRFHDTRDDR